MLCCVHHDRFRASLGAATLFAFSALLWCVPAAAQDDAAAEHTELRADHEEAEAEHQAWMESLVKMKIEHRQALAALKRLEAEILQHEAELEVQMLKIQMHSRKIAEHDKAIEKHESGAQTAHDELTAEHRQIMATHKKMAKMMKQINEDHQDLISGVIKMAKQHLGKFHAEK
jgi:chromosome segregation ATPase